MIREKYLSLKKNSVQHKNMQKLQKVKRLKRKG